jgi:hypothetical protein
METKRLHTSDEVIEIAGITYRQLDYWTRKKWAHPADTRYPGSGKSRYYSDDETQRLALMALLVDAGILPNRAHELTRIGWHDANGTFRAWLSAPHVFVEVIP